MPRCSAFCAPVTNDTAGSSDDPSRGILELAATRKGTSPSPLRSFPNFAKGHRDGHRSARRGQNRRIRTPARDVLSVLRYARFCSEGHWPRLDMGFAVARSVWPRHSARRPLVARRGHSSHRMAQGSGRARDSKKTADDTRWKGNAQGQEQAPFRRRRQFPEGDSCSSETGLSSETARTGDEMRKGQRHEICQRGDRHSSFPSQPWAASDPAASQPTPCAVTATKHELGLSPLYRVVSYGSALEVWALLMRLSHPACTRRSTCRGAALASCLDPLAFSGDKRGRSKALFFAVLNGTSISDPEPVNFSCDPENWACGRAPSEPTAKAVISAHSSFLPLARQMYRYSIGFLHARRTIFATLTIPRRLMTTPHSLL